MKILYQTRIKIETDLKNENTTSKIKHKDYKYRLAAEHMGLNPSTTKIKQKRKHKELKINHGLTSPIQTTLPTKSELGLVLQAVSCRWLDLTFKATMSNLVKPWLR